MIELLLVTDLVVLQPADDAIDIYSGDTPPAATFQTVDQDSTVDSTETAGQ